MSKFTNELYDLMEKSYLEENDPIQLTFSNRIYKKYGKDFNKKYDYISGKNLEYITEKLKSQNLTELQKISNSSQNSLLNSLQEYNEEKKEEYIPQMMYVPEEIRPEWVASNTKKYFLSDANKRELLEEYLSSLSEENQKKAIAVMCENTNSKNYLNFLDLSTTAYTPNQEILSNDLINFFHNKYLNEYIDQQKTMQRFNYDVYTKQKTLEKDNSSDEIYNKTIKDKHYFNPYDKNEMLTPSITHHRQFLDDQQKQDAIFNIIDQNSALYLKQQTEFKNDYLNKENLMNKIHQQNINRNQSNHFDEKLAMYNQKYNELKANDILNRDVNENTFNNSIQQSLIVEIPKVNNIAEFIEQRMLLNQQNSIRKQNNIIKTIDYNNNLVGANVVYQPNIVNANYQVNNISSNNLQQQKKPLALNKNNIEHESINNIYNSELAKNMHLASTNQEQSQQKHSNTNMAYESINNIYNSELAKNMQSNSIIQSNNQQPINDYSINQLDMNYLPTKQNIANVDKIKSYAHVAPTNNPNEAYLNNRYNAVNNYPNSSYILNQNKTSETTTVNLNQSVDMTRMQTIDNIQKFFTNKPVVKKQSIKVSEKIDNENIPTRKRKAQGRMSKKEIRTNKSNNQNNQLVVKHIKINRGIINEKNDVKKQVNQNVKKAVLV